MDVDDPQDAAAEPELKGYKAISVSAFRNTQIGTIHAAGLQFPVYIVSAEAWTTTTDLQQRQSRGNGARFPDAGQEVSALK